MIKNIFRSVIPPCNGNLFVYSKLNQTEFETKRVPGIGIKFGISGQENYIVSNKEFILKENEYLVVNHNQDFSAQIPGTATGLCLQISNEIINDVQQSLLTGAKELPQHDKDQSPSPLYFINHISNAALSNTGSILMQLKNVSYEPGATGFTEEIFYRLGVNLVTENMDTYTQVNRLLSKKKHTKEELYRRIKRAKEIMDDCYLKELQVDEIAKEVNLSKFYFLQAYKKIFGVSPYQYLIFKRLSYAKHLLVHTDFSISEIALLSGYSDIYIFSKSFKKVFSVAPSSFR